MVDQITVKVVDVYQTCELSQCQPTSFNWLEKRSGYSITSVKDALSVLVRAGCIKVSNTGHGSRPIRVECIKAPIREGRVSGKSGRRCVVRKKSMSRIALEYISGFGSEGVELGKIESALMAQGLALTQVKDVLKRGVRSGDLRSIREPSSVIPNIEKFEFDDKKAKRLMGDDKVVYDEFKNHNSNLDVCSALRGKVTHVKVLTTIKRLKFNGYIHSEKFGRVRYTYYSSCDDSAVNSVLYGVELRVYEYILRRYGLNSAFNSNYGEFCEACKCSAASLYSSLRSLVDIGVLNDFGGEVGRFEKKKYCLIKEVV